MKSSFRSLSKPLHAMPSYTNSITHASPFLATPPYMTQPSVSLSFSFAHIQKHTASRPHPVHRTDSAVLSVPAWAAFTLAVLAGAMFAAARVACPLIAHGTHPTLLTAAAARHADAMASTVRRTKLCWSERGREGEREGDRKDTEGVIEHKSRSYCQRSDGHAPLACLMALEKEFSRLIREERIPFGQNKSNKFASKRRREAGTRSDCPTAPRTFVAKQKKWNPI